MSVQVLNDETAAVSVMKRKL